MKEVEAARRLQRSLVYDDPEPSGSLVTRHRTLKGIIREPTSRSTAPERHLARERTAVLLLDEIDADIQLRDELVIEYEKAKATSDRANNKTMTLYSEIQRLDSRAAKTREAFEVIRGRTTR